MKTKILSLIAIVTMSFALNAQIDRSKMPKPGPDPVVKLGKAKEFKLKNGMRVIMVENHKLPRASANLTIDNKPVFEGDIAGVSSMMGSLLGRGTASITKDEFNEKVDFLGANINFYSGGAYASSLAKYFPEILELMADGVKNSEFSQEEFDKEVKITLDGIKSNEKSVTTIARRVENVLNYGKNHPYGEFTSKESVAKINLEDVKQFYTDYYRPNNAYLIIEGDINPKEIKKLVKKLFSDWNKGTIPTQEMPVAENVSATEINFINMSNAVQSEIAVINNTNLKLGDEDYYATLLANQILGGGGTARLFQNLRENKGYTYGSYSSIRQDRYAASFKATASVRNMVTDSSVVEIKKEINKIRTEKVTEEELKNVKEKYIGSFVMDVQKPRTAASYALNIARYNLPKDFYANYIQNINAVTLEDVQNAALKHFKADNARIVITGKGIEVLNNLEKSGYRINYFDAYGNATEKPEMTMPIPNGMTTADVVDKYIMAIGGEDKVNSVKTIMMVSKATVQGTPIMMITKASDKNKSSQAISVMGNVMQKTVFNGKTGYSEARGNKMPMTEEQLSEATKGNALFNDLAYTSGKLIRIEPIENENAIVLKYNDTEVFYYLKSGLKIKEVKTVKTPDGEEVKIPTTFSDYKAVNGILFPHAIGVKSGPMNLDFKISEIKINEGVSDADFE